MAGTHPREESILRRPWMGRSHGGPLAGVGSFAEVRFDSVATVKRMVSAKESGYAARLCHRWDQVRGGLFVVDAGVPARIDRAEVAHDTGSAGDGHARLSQNQGGADPGVAKPALASRNLNKRKPLVGSRRMDSEGAEISLMPSPTARPTWSHGLMQAVVCVGSTRPLSE